MSNKHPDPLKGERKEDILSQKEVQDSIRYGVSEDKLDYKKLFGLFFAGIILVLVLVYASMTLFRYYAFVSSQQAAINATFYELEDLKERHHKDLTSFGVMDESAGIYKVPVDSAFTLILEDYAN